MTKKKAIDLKKGDSILIAGKAFKIIEIETSDVAKQGSQKCRIIAQNPDTNEKVVIIRPSDYPFEVK